MTFWHKLRHWPIITRTYIEKFDSVTATGQINYLQDVHTITFGNKLRHWPIVLTYIEKFDSVTATSHINLLVGCQLYFYFLSFPTSRRLLANFLTDLVCFLHVPYSVPLPVVTIMKSHLIFKKEK